MNAQATTKPARSILAGVRKAALPAAFPITAAPWKYTVGVELTWVAGFIPPALQVGRSLGYNEYDTYDIHVAAALRDYKGKGKPTMHRISRDCGCVEASTLPLQSWSEFSKTASWYYNAAKKYGYTNTAAHCAGGGGHIHIGLQNQPTNLANWAFVDMTGRPYITRAFSYFADAQNAIALPVPDEASLTHNGNKTAAEWLAHIRNFQAEIITHTRTLHAADSSAGTRYKASCDIKDALYYLARRRKDYATARRLEGLAAGDAVTAMQRRLATEAFKYGNARDKYRVLRTTNYGTHGTVEFRCFQSTKTVAENEAHIAFVLAYMGYVKAKQAADDLRIPEQETPTEDKPQHVCDREAFMAFIAELGLPAEPYLDYADNITQRWTHFNGKHGY